MMSISLKRTELSGLDLLIFVDGRLVSAWYSIPYRFLSGMRRVQLAVHHWVRTGYVRI